MVEFASGFYIKEIGMKQFINIIVFLFTLLFLSGCGSSNSSNKLEFTSAMIEDQPFYTFDEKNIRWIRVIFDNNAQVIYEFLTGSEIGGTYSIKNGKIIVSDNDKNPVIALNSVQSTLWEVTGIDDDGKVWQDTWHLEQKFTSDMIVGKRFSSQFEKEGVLVKEEYLFSDMMVKVLNSDGTFRGEYPYQLEEGALHVTEDTKEFMLYLMSTEENDDFNIWYSSDVRSGSSVWSLEPEVYGPGGAFAGATEFSSAMVEGQVIYTFNEKDNVWIGVEFYIDGQITYEILNGKEFGDTYSIEDGKIVVRDSNNNIETSIALDVAKSTVWEVTGTDDDGKVWQDTWHLNLKFTSEMIVGKRFLSEFVSDGIAVEEELLFSETTLKIYNMDGTLREELPYTLENGALKVTNEEGEFTLSLMFIESNGRINAWYLAEGESGHSAWTPIESL